MLSFHLSDEFVTSYEKRKPEWGFPAGGGNSLGEITFLTKYSRRNEDGTRERWHETCARVVNGYYSILKDHCKQNRTPWNEFKAQKAAEDAYERLFTFKWTPPGRGLWMMGTPMVHEQKNSAALQNCFAGTERLITREFGSVAFAEVSGETLTVLTPEGWSKAEVSHFGKQAVQRVTFGPARSDGSLMRSNVRESVWVTRDHRWILSNGDETTSLSVGDLVEGISAAAELGPEYWAGVAHGLVFGDGNMITHRYANSEFGFELRVCDRRTRDLLESSDMLVDQFDGVYLDRPSANGDPIYRKRTHDNLKDFPVGKSPDYLAGFLKGWCVADAEESGNGWRLSSTHPGASGWLKSNAALSGYQIVGDNYDSVMETNFGRRNAPVRRFTLRPSTLWKVVSVEGDVDADVYCATVPDVGSFVLESGIHTGNCAFISTEKLSTHSAAEATLPFIRLMEMSMLGVGVGFDTKGAGSLTIHAPKPDAVFTVQIEDTREGWYESVGTLLESYFFKNRPWVEFDYSLIRAQGELIKTFGGIAAGPDPLKELHRQIRELFAGRAGETITSSDIVDIMNMVGKCVVSGNVRRSAEIAVGGLHDEDFLNLKDWNVNPERMGADGWGHTSNNSVFASVGEDVSHLVNRIAMNGEPGILYLDLCRKFGRLIEPENNKDERVAGTNPCITADTWIATTEGARRVGDLVGTPFRALVNGKPYEATGFWKTGDKPVLKITFKDGRRLRLTPNHQVLRAEKTRKKIYTEWIEAGELSVGDSVVIHDHRGSEWAGKGTFDQGYVLGHLIGDGTFSDGRAKLTTWDKDLGSTVPQAELLRIAEEMGVHSSFRGWSGPHGNGWNVLSTRSIDSLAEDFGIVQGNKVITDEIESGSSAFTAGILRGLFDTDGSVQGGHEKGVSVRLSQSNLALLESVQRMLARLGVNSKIYKRADAGQSFLPDGRGGHSWHDTLPQWEVVVANDNLQTFASRVGFWDDKKLTKLSVALTSLKRRPNRERFTAEIASIEEDGVEAVYDASVADVHAFDANGLYVHNCGEQSLESYECCTLVETFPTKHESLEDYKKTLKHAYLYAKAVTLLPTHWPETNEIMQRNRRIGCSMSGVAQFVESDGWTKIRTWMNEGYETVRQRDRQYSEWLGVRESIKMTSVKPSGTVSLLAGVTPGVHWPTDTIYIRRMRLAVSDPLVEVLQKAGYHTEADVKEPLSTVVVELPVAGPQVRTEREVSMWEKADLAIVAQRYWADNQVSVTVTFLPEESDHIGALLQAKEGQLKSISMLPITESGAYKQMPYEAIDINTYNEMVGRVGPMDMDRLYLGDSLDAEGEKYCTNDRCELPV